MIIGIGTDIVEVSRIEKLIEKNPSFLDKVYTDAEIAYCRAKAAMAQSFAARFAAKEAVMKAFGTGWAKGVSFKEIEVVNDGEGKPMVALSGKSLDYANKLRFQAIHLSLSHEKGYAVAFVVIERKTSSDCGCKQ